MQQATHDQAPAPLHPPPPPKTEELTSSANSTLEGPTSISPLVTRFFCPPLMPRIMALPTRVSEQPSRPSALIVMSVDRRWCSSSARM